MGGLSDWWGASRNWHKQVWEGLEDDPWRILTGFDPLSTMVSNTLLNRDDEPLGDWLGGPTSDMLDDPRYSRSEKKSANDMKVIIPAIVGTILTGGALAGAGGAGAGGGGAAGGGGGLGGFGSALGGGGSSLGTGSGGFGLWGGGGAGAGGVGAGTTSGGIGGWGGLGGALGGGGGAGAGAGASGFGGFGDMGWQDWARLGQNVMGQQGQQQQQGPQYAPRPMPSPSTYMPRDIGSPDVYSPTRARIFGLLADTDEDELRTILGGLL